MKLLTPTSPHIHSGASINAIMTRVLLALLPAVLAYTFFFGWGLIINIILCIGFAIAMEGWMLVIRKRPLEPFINDFSVVVTAVLLAFCLPPLCPWWLVMIGCFFAVVVGKHLYGGLGYNPFNPAMVGYVVLLIAFPRDMTAWLPPFLMNDLEINFFNTLIAKFGADLPYGLQLDGITMATPLDTVKTQLGLSETVAEITRSSALFGDFGGVGWEWIGNWIFLGGIWLVIKKITSWHIPLSMLGSLFAIALIFYLIDPDHYAGPMFHLFSGAAMLGAFFIATDPVTAASTPGGKIIFGAGIGILTYIIRVWGGYPDGVGFAVLLMNLAAPTIDYYTQPRVYGHSLNEPHGRGHE